MCIRDRLPVDPLVQVQLDQPDPVAGSDLFTVPTRNVPGMGYSGVNPPDTVGDIGMNYYIQSINTGGGADVRIWDKATPPNVVTTFRMDSLGTGACAGGFGDPVVLYDRQAERWMISEFAGSGNHLCVYVSQTGDPVAGGWFAYDFQTASFPDYPKYAVWSTDAEHGAGSYVATFNDDNIASGGIMALERGAMIVGLPASTLPFQVEGLSGFVIQGPAPADPDGPNPPPDGAAAILLRHRDTEVHDGPAATADLLEGWLFDVSWTDPGSTTWPPSPLVSTCGASFDALLPSPLRCLK